MPANTTAPATRRRPNRVRGKDRDRVGRAAVALYADLYSIREIAAKLGGWSYGATHRLLTEYGATMRARGSGVRGKSRR